MSRSKRAEMVASIRQAADRAGTLVLAAFATSAAALLVAAVALVIVVRIRHGSA